MTGRPTPLDDVHDTDYLRDDDVHATLTSRSPSRLRRRAIGPIVSLFLVLVARAVTAQTTPTYPDCISSFTTTVPVPQATSRVQYSWQAYDAVSLDDVRYYIDGREDHYTYLTDASWTIDATTASGTLVSQSGTTIINPFTWSCNYYKATGCVPIDPKPPVPVGGEQMLSLGSLAASANSSITIRTKVMVGRVTIRRVATDGTSTVLDTCNPAHVTASASVVIPHVFVPSVGSPDDRMMTRLAAPWDVDQYSSYLQRRTSDTFAGVALGTRPQFLLSAYGYGLPPNSRAWFRVLDPPDRAPYAMNPTDGDNTDPTGGKLYTSDQRSAPIGTAISADLDANGSLTFALEGSDQYAGDNYEVISSPDPPGADGRFPCEAPGNCATTGVITVWKRLYYEQASMAKAGAFLARDVAGGSAPCSPADPCEIELRSTAVNGVPVIVPGGDLTIVAAGGPLNTPGPTPHSEVVTVDANSATLGPAIRMVGPERFVVRLTSRPTQNYFGAPYPLRASYGDAVMATPDVWTADPTGLETALASAFVEYVATPSAAVVPFLGVVHPQDGAALKRWFRSIEPFGQFKAKPNHRIVVAADRYVTDSRCGTLLGYRVTGARYSYIFTNTIQQGFTSSLDRFYAVSPTQADQRDVLPAACVGYTITGIYGATTFSADDLLYGATTHEAIHQFNVNPTDPLHGGHCTVRDYSGTYRCLMNADYASHASELGGRILSMHRGGDGEYDAIRRESDPSQ